VAKARWKTLCADCSGGIDSLVELLQGRFSKGAMERICRQDTGLFPRPSEIRFTCSCLDHASMCKHVAAVLYGVGARLDQSPELLFRLRAVDETELLSDLGTALPDARTERDTAKTLGGGDLAALFGLDMAEDEAPAASPSVGVSSAGPRRKSGASVVAHTPAVTVPVAATKARAAKSAQKSTASPTRPAPKKTAGGKTESRSKPMTATPTNADQEAPGKAMVPTRHRSSAAPAIAVAVAVGEKQPPRPMTSGADRPARPPRRGHGAARGA
jgi:uncharacterized Zn finger protein